MVQATEAPGRRWNSPPILLTLGARTVAPEDTAAASAAEPNRGEYDAAVRMSLPTDWSALPSVGTADSHSGAPRGRLGRPSLNEGVLSVGSSGWGVAEVSAWLVVVTIGVREGLGEAAWRRRRCDGSRGMRQYIGVEVGSRGRVRRTSDLADKHGTGVVGTAQPAAGHDLRWVSVHGGRLRRCGKP